MFDKKCPRCGAETIIGFRHNIKDDSVEKILICNDCCGYTEPYETTAEKIKRMNAATELLMQPVQGITLVEQMANEVVMQKEKDISRAIVRSCVAVDVDPEALVKTAQLNQNLQSKLKALVERFTWVPCSERLPEKEGQYLVVLKSPTTGYRYQNVLSYYTGNEFCSGSYMVPTHWMEVPELPEEEEAYERNG